jgi:hypothetical protein
MQVFGLLYHGLFYFSSSPLKFILITIDAEPTLTARMAAQKHRNYRETRANTAVLGYLQNNEFLTDIQDAAQQHSPLQLRADQAFGARG